MRAGYTEITESDPSKLRSWTGNDVFKAVDVLASGAERVASGVMAKAAFDELQMAYGLNFNPRGLLANVALRPFWDPVAVMRYDWVHNTLAHGVLTTEAALLLSAAEPLGVSRNTIEEFLKDPAWQFCKAHAATCKKLHRMFSHWRLSSTDPTKLNVCASELLSLYGFLRAFINVRLKDMPEVADQVASFNACCRLVDTIVKCKRGLTSVSEAAREVQRLACDHMKAFIRAYGTGPVKPKAHWNIDVAAQFLQDNAVVDMFIVERTHLDVKRIADNVRNTARFERSVLSRLLAETLSPAIPNGCPHSLHGNVRQVADCTWVSDRLTSYGMHVHIGDIVCHGSCCGEVATCLLQGVELNVVVLVFQPLGGGIWSRGDGPYELWSTLNLFNALAWKVLADGSVFVLQC